jgi:hypothetical protein
MKPGKFKLLRGFLDTTNMISNHIEMTLLLYQFEFDTIDTRREISDRILREIEILLSHLPTHEREEYFGYVVRYTEDIVMNPNNRLFG